MVDYQTYEELPKRIQYYVNSIKETGYDDIRSFQFPCKYFGGNSFGCSIWIDAEEMVKGLIPYRGVIQNMITNSLTKNIFNIGYLHISVHYKNKQQLGKKFLPELKKRLKESLAGKYIHSVRFDENSRNNDPEVFVVLRRDNDIETWGIVKNILEDFKIEKGYPNLYVKIS
jgi:hypothetical protein